MKKIWFVIIILCILALGDIVFTMFLKGENDTEDASEPVKQAEKVNEPDKKEPEQNSGKAPIEKKSPEKEEKDKDNRLYHKVDYKAQECLDFTKQILSKNVFELKKQDLSFIENMGTTDAKEEMINAFAKYQICLSLETRNVGICNKMSDYFDYAKSIEECKILYRLLIPFQAHYVMKMTPEQFVDLYEEEEKELKDWMYEFFMVLYKNDSDSCKRIADTKDMLDICKYAIGALTEAPEEENWKQLYYTFLAIKTGKLSYMVKFKQSRFLEAVAQTALGRKDSCKTFFETKMKSFCSLPDKKD